MNRKLVLLLLLSSVLLLYSCGVAKAPLSRAPSHNNPDYEVSYLFEHDGVKVYRFFDMGNSVYFTAPSSDVLSIKNDSTRHRTQTIGNANE